MLTLFQNQTIESALHLALSIGLVLLLIIVSLWFHKRNNALYATLAGAAACFIGLHTITFANPVFWHHAMATLTSEKIGGRQYAVMAQEQRVRTQPTRDPAELLAVGSSQTDAIFRNVAKQQDDVGILQLPRFGILDYWLYRHEIVARDANLLMLYMSEIDWGRAPTFNASRLAPEQGMSTLDLMQLFSELGDPATREQQRTFFKEHFAGGLFPEFRFAYLTRGLLDEHLAVNVQRAAAGVSKDATPPSTPASEVLLAQAQTQLNDKSLPLYRELFNRFLRYTEQANQCVLLVDGQYFKQLETHPVLAKKVQELLVDMSSEHPHVVWLPRSELPPIASGPDDWLDAFHIGIEAGDRYGIAIANKAKQLLRTHPKLKNCGQPLQTATLN